MSIALVGELGVDTIETPGGRCENSPGGSCLFMGVVASLLSPVSLHCCVGNDFHKHFEFLSQRSGVDLRYLRYLREEKLYRWQGRYEDWDEEPLDIAWDCKILEYSPFEKGCSYPFSRILVLGACNPKHQKDALQNISHDFCFADTYSSWLQVSARRQVFLRDVLPKVDGLFMNSSEFNILFSPKVQEKFSVFISDETMRYMFSTYPRLSFAVIKRGRKGFVCLSRGGDVFSLPAYPGNFNSLIDPTGAGDTFLGAFASYFVYAKMNDFRLSCLRKPLLYASLIAYKAVTRFGVLGLEDLTKDKILLEMHCMEQAMYLNRNKSRIVEQV